MSTVRVYWNAVLCSLLLVQHSGSELTVCVWAAVLPEHSPLGEHAQPWVTAQLSRCGTLPCPGLGFYLWRTFTVWDAAATSWAGIAAPYSISSSGVEGVSFVPSTGCGSRALLPGLSGASTEQLGRGSAGRKGWMEGRSIQLSTVCQKPPTGGWSYPASNLKCMTVNVSWLRLLRLLGERGDKGSS